MRVAANSTKQSGVSLDRPMPNVYVFTRDVPVNHPVLGICRVSHYPVLTGTGKIIDPSKFIFFQTKILNRIV